MEVLAEAPRLNESWIPNEFWIRGAERRGRRLRSCSIAKEFLIGLWYA